ncbi:MAG: hypothetical protein GC153_13490 [Alphaproteobacteria bacterium]|nr:hypothetical protein [Alphaproteobacteria bacterium]
MKPKHVEELLRAMKAKTQLEQARLAAIRSVQARLEEEKAALRAQIAPANGALVASGADLVIYARRIAALERAVDGKKRAIAMMEPQRIARESGLRKSLREETAWNRLVQELRFAARREKEAREEERREALSRLAVARR